MLLAKFYNYGNIFFFYTADLPFFLPFFVVKKPAK